MCKKYLKIGQVKKKNTFSFIVCKKKTNFAAELYGKRSKE